MQAPGSYGPGLALEPQLLLDGLGDGGRGDEAVSPLREEDLAWPCARLEPLREDDRLAGREGLSRRRVARQDLAGGDADPDAQPDAELPLHLLVESLPLLPQLHRRADGSERVVLVQRRDSEDRHDGIADELLHRAAVSLERRPHRCEVPVQHLSERLGIEPLAQRR